MALAGLKGWSIGALDIKTAFLHAELCDEEDGVYIVTPPAIAVRHGLIKPGTVWKLKKVLYGLRSGPKKWGEHRDQQLREAEVSCGDKKGTFAQNEFVR